MIQNDHVHLQKDTVEKSQVNKFPGIKNFLEMLVEKGLILNHPSVCFLTILPVRKLFGDQRGGEGPGEEDSAQSSASLMTHKGRNIAMMALSDAVILPPFATPPPPPHPGNNETECSV